MRWAKLLWVSLAGALGAAGCAPASFNPAAMDIVKDVTAIAPMALSQICVEVNTEAKTQLTEGLFRALDELGFHAQSKQAAFGDECRYWLRYKATWGGFPEHLLTAQIDVLDHRAVIGAIRYDSTRAGSRPDRYGTAVSKLEPLLAALFVRVERENGRVPELAP